MYTQILRENFHTFRKGAEGKGAQARKAWKTTADRKGETVNIKAALNDVRMGKSP